MRSRILSVAAFLVLASPFALAGGPAYVAGAGYDPGVEGQPLLWANATVEYFTDQGPLSPILTNAQANAFVAAAIAPWMSAPGVGLNVYSGGELAEDVNGSNIQVDDGVITAPADVTPQATGTPLGIIYDYDGTVTDAILGAGAGDLDECFTNAVFGGPNNFSASGNIIHAIIVINGVCAAASSQLTDVQYRLMRVLANCFGLGWSQANINVLTGDPQPTQQDYQGFPLMHFLDPPGCVPISSCYGGIFGGALGNYTITPALDDSTAMARLYPAPSGNPQPTGRIYGNVYFTNSSGNAAQGMQGVNVVARLIDNTGNPSRQYVVTSVSGFEFTGNAGNIITGYVEENGICYAASGFCFGSTDTSIEGSFDLGQLMIPSGQTTAQYQLSVEAINPTWSWGVEPYGPSQVEPSGSFAPVVITIQSGSNLAQNVLMLGSEIAQQPSPGSSSTYANPAQLPLGGGWASWISGYGFVDFFEFTAQANRTASVAVTAFDENGNPTESKLMPVIGIWELSDETGDPAPASTPSAFNSETFGMTRLDAQFSDTEAYRLGVADSRGDGRPDYYYQASLLYSDTVTPARLSLAGGVTTLEGIGFIPGLQVSVGNNNGVVLVQSATQLQISLPSAPLDGLATIQVTDPVSGSFSQMQGALTYGAAATDLLLLMQGSEPSTPAGAQAANPIRVRAVASDGVTPVNGATIAWSATNGVEFSACGGGIACSVLTDESGEASTWVTPTTTGQATITAALAPASYQPAQTQQATLVATSSSLDLAAITPTRWIAYGATLSLPLTVEALDQGAPLANVSIQFTITNGIATLSAGIANTNSSGLASVTAQFTSLNSTVQVSACVAPGNNPCQTFTILAVPASAWTLEPVSGTAQIVLNGQPFQPLIMRVTDGSAANNPVMGVNVNFATTLERNPQGPGGGPPGGDRVRAQDDGSPVILGTSQSQVATDQNGLASITPSAGNVGPCDVYLVISAGVSVAQFELENVDPITANQQPQPGTRRNGSPGSPRVGSGGIASPDEQPPATLFATPDLAAVSSLPAACSADADGASPSSDSAIPSASFSGDPQIQPCNLSPVQEKDSQAGSQSVDGHDGAVQVEDSQADNGPATTRSADPPPDGPVNAAPSKTNAALPANPAPPS